MQVKNTKKPILILFYLGLALTVFFLSIYRGTVSAYRTEQGIPFYIGAIALLLSSKIINLNGKKVLKAVLPYIEENPRKDWIKKIAEFKANDYRPKDEDTEIKPHQLIKYIVDKECNTEDEE